MKTIKGYVVLKEQEYYNKLDAFYKDGLDDGAEDAQDRIESLEKGLKKKDKEIKNLKEEQKEFEEYHDKEVQKLNEQLDVYEEDRDDVREVMKQKLANADKQAALEALKEGLDAREAKLKDRAARLEEDEAGEYKKGYADGVADGVRKISEITQEDRNQAMKVAMVSAASHSTPQVIKELANGTKALTEGTTDGEDEES